MINFIDISRKNVTYDHIKSHKKSGLHPLFRKHNFGKTTGTPARPRPSLRSTSKLPRSNDVKVRKIKPKVVFIYIYIYIHIYILYIYYTYILSQETF